MNLPITSWKKTLRKLGRKANWQTLIRNRRLPALPLDNDPLTVEMLEPRHMLSVVVDFDYTSEGTQLAAGEVITNQWADDGVYISTDDPANNPAMIFDSGNITGGDSDLGTANVDFGGPGIGAGGSVGAAGENAIALGNVLIISKDGNSLDPDDREAGGTFVFDFDSSVSVEQVDLLDIGSSETVTFRMFDQNQNLVAQTQVAGLGENSVQTVVLDSASIVRMEIEFESDGAISGLVFAEVDEQIYVVDRYLDEAFRYDIDGNAIDWFSLEGANRSRGAATSPDGSTLYVLNANREVFVFDTETDSLTGSWRANGVTSAVQGIATDGQNIWIVDRRRDRVYYFENAADNLSGSQDPTCNFRLDNWNYSASGITTDGENIWVVDRGSDDVFVYDTDGNSLGRWELDSRNRRPTGIAIDPNGSGGLWVLDGLRDQVYFYADGREFQSGRHAATSTFALDNYNFWGEGIAIGSSETGGLPMAPTIEFISDDSGASNTDGITNDNTLMISGSAGAGDQVTLTATGVGVLGTSTANSSGTWMIDATSIVLADGQYVLTATSSNGSGTSDPSSPFNLTIDTAAPVNLAVTEIDDDTGVSDSDQTTSDNTLIVSGLTEPNSLVTLSETLLGVLGSATADSGGNWSVDLTSMVLPDGNYFFTATATDLAGNETTPSAPLAVEIDTSSPSPPTINAISDDTGSSSSDRITNNPVQTFSGTAEPVTLITLTDDVLGELATTVSDSSGNWSVEITLTESTYAITATATDLAGNESPPSSLFTVVIDQTPPGEPTIDSIDTDSGITGDGVTNDDTLLFRGSAEAGSLVTLSESLLGVLGTVITDATGFWEFDASGTPLADGSYSFSVIAEDVAGNVSNPSQPFEVTVDSVAPSAPSIVRIDDDNGAGASDGITNDNTLIFTGMASPNATVDVFETTLGFIGAATANSSGVWVLDATSIVLADGTYEFTAVAEDVAGNLSPISAPLNVEIDTVVPAQAAITSIDSDTGSIPNDGVTSDDTLVFNGTAEAGTLVTLIETVMGVMGTATADSLGVWQIDATNTPLVDGAYSFTVTAEDLAGNVSTPSAPFNVVVDTVGPSAPSILRVDDDTGVSNTDSVTNDNTLNFIGMAAPESIVSVFEATLGLIGTTTTDGAGVWALDATAIVLADGAYAFTAVAEDLAGNVSPPSAVLDVIIDTVAPVQPVITGFDDDTGSSSNDGVTNDNTIVLFGTAEALTEVTISDPVIGVLGSTTADATGNWQLDASGTILADGIYDFTALSSDLAGNTSQSSGFGIMVDTVAPDVPVILGISDDTGASSSDGVTSDSTLSISGLADANAIVSVFEATLGLIGTTTADGTGMWTLDATGTILADGDYSLTATSEDLAGNISAASTVFDVVVDTVAPQTPTLDLDPAFDTPPVGDQTTDETQVTLIGTTEPGAFVTLLETGQNVVADANGNFAFTAVDLVSGPNIFTVVATDLAGNESQFVQTINSTFVDIDDPVVFVELSNDTGPSSADLYTTDPTLAGSVDDASPVTAEFGLYHVLTDTDYFTDITARLDPNGDFELDQAFLENLVGGTLPYGRFLYYVDAFDSAGNYGFYEGELTFIQSDDDDITPPVVTVELLNDTGTNSTDHVTVDASLTGTVVDESPIDLSIEFFNADILDFFNGNVTDLLQPDGSYVISQNRMEQIAGAPLISGPYQVRVTARDIYSESHVFLSFELATPPSPPVIASIDTDTGISDTDGITRDTTLTIAGTSEPFIEVELSEASLGSIGTTFADSNGDWNIQLSGPGLVDGHYEFTAVSISPMGETSDPSNVYVVTVDTQSPLRAIFDLDPAFDTGVVGDSYTTLGVVTLTGTTLPNAEVRLVSTGQSAIANASGVFSLANVQLELGRHIYQIEAFDAAGNSKISQKSIAYDQPISLSELGFVTEATQLVDLGQEVGTRSVTFRIDADFGTNPATFEDALLVYLVDPANPSTTLLDRGQPGTALFSLVGDQVEYLPGLVRFDGSVVEIDVTGVEGFSEGMLLFQLINNDSDTATQISISQIGSNIDDAGVPSPVFVAPIAVTPGDSLNVAGLTISTGITVLYENIRYDSATNSFIADIRVRNDGPDVGRTIVVTFDSLAPDITLLNASDTDGNGNPYVSMRNAIPTYGLTTGQVSDAVRVEFTAPTVSPFAVAPVVTDGGPNSAPLLDPIGTLNVLPGDVVRINLSASDADGEGFYYWLNGADELPNMTLTAGGQLVIAPEPDQIGNYTFEVVASDGLLSSTQLVTLNVIADPVTTTRISGVIMDTNSVPLADIPVELGGSQVLTAADGSFELSFTGALPDDTLLIRGEFYAGPEVYPFIAEKLPLLLGHDAYDSVNNVIDRPIYLPALDVANGVTIDPLVDITVTTPAIPNASVFVAAGTLETQGGGLFTGDLSITQVPVDFTPAALPPDLFPDLVVTIQPGEMVFTTPAPLNLPNLAGYLPGTEMTLWSINPNTGLFDNVGIGVVSVDGTTVETVSGGINNSSWHFFAPDGPAARLFNPRNQDKECNDCEEIDAANSDHAPHQNSAPENGNSNLDTEFLDRLIESFYNPYKNNPAPTSGSSTSGGSGTASGGNRGGFDGGWGTGGTMLFNGSADFGPYGSYNIGGSGGMTYYFGPNSSSNVVPSNNSLLSGNDWNANDTQTALHSGAVYKSHDLVPYQSLGSWHGLQLNYDSERADARPIVSIGFDNVQSSLANPTLASKLVLTRGNVRIEVPGYSGTQSGLTGGEHFFAFSSGATSLDVAIQADMRSMSTGVYEFETTNRFTGNISGSFAGTATTTQERLVHVNTMNSPFGAGWGLRGLLEIVENPDGSVLIVDGSGGELLFEAPAIEGEAYDSPAGDFSTLLKLGNGRFQRTHVDATVEEYSATNKLERVTDRNGNETLFQYNANDNLEFIVDPLGLTTTLRYTNGQVTEIEDPAGRITTLTYENGNLVSIQDPDTKLRQFSYDAAHHLTSETDKLDATESIQYGFSGRIESITRKDGSTVQYSPVQTQGLYRPEQTINLEAILPAFDFGQQPFADKVDANGNVTRVQLDKQGQLLDAQDAEGDLPEVSRNDENLVQRIVDGRGNLTTINYDDRGNVISISDSISRGATTAPLFSDPVYPVDTFALQIVAADLNNDGFVDIVTENDIADSVSVLLGNGGGGFSGRKNYSVVNSTSLQVADVNNDGLIDVVTANQGDQVSVLLGNGDGTLQTALTFATGDNPQFIQTADLNNDGFVDLVTADNSSGTVSVLLGDGTGQFNSFSSYAVAAFPIFLAVGDINNDNFVDIVAANKRTTDGLSILLGNGDGTFAPATFISTSEATEHVELGDVTGDGNLDIVTGDRDLLVLPGLGDGTFGAEQETITNSTSGTTGATLVDVDSDGDLDVVFTETSIDTITVFENDGTGTLSLTQTIATPDGPFSTLGVDLNLDGIVDLVTLSANTDTIVPLLGLGDGTFAEIPPPNTNSVSVGDGPTSLAVGDFNNDGHQDVVVGAQIDSSITVMLGGGDGTLTPLTPIAAGGLVLYVAAADLDQDGNLDLVSAHYNSNTLEIRYGDGSGGFAAPISIAVPEGPRQVQFGDFNNDTDLDIAAVGHKGAAEPWFSTILSNGNRTFATPVNLSSRYQASTIDVGDIDNDGNLDLVLGVSYFSDNNAARPYLGNGDGTFVDQGRIFFGGGPFAGPPRQLKLVDLDGDGNLDIVGVDEPTNSLRVLKGNGNGSFEDVVGYALDDGARTLDVGDINNDGLLDVIATNINSDRVSVFFGKNDGFLTSHQEFTVGDGPYAVKLVDLDEDGSLDFVTTDSNADAISIRLNSTDLANQSAQVFEYDPVFNQLTRSIDEQGREVLYNIDPTNGNTLSVTKVIGAVGGGDDITTLYTYTSNGLIDTITDPLGRVTDMDYNVRGLLERITFALGTADEASITYEYDAAGNQTAVVDELGHRTEYVYDDLNRITQVTEADPDGAGPLQSPVSTNVYDDHGNLVSATDAENNTTQFVYDEQHRLVETIDADLESIRHEYDETGNLTATVDRLGRRTEFIYDERNRLIETVNADGGRAKNVYDADNNVVAVVDENGVSTSFIYDARNRLVQSTNALGGTLRYEYDRVDNVIAMIDELGRRTEMTYDELDRNTTMTLPDPDKGGPQSAPVTVYVYDDANNLVSTTDALGNTTVMMYDERDRLVKVTDPDPDGAGPLVSPEWNYVYDDASRLVSTTDPLNRETSFVYDDLNRLIMTSFPDPDGPGGPEPIPQMSYTYDAVGNQLTKTDTLGNTTVFDYDNLYRLVSVTDPDPDGPGPLLSPVTTNSYDVEGQLVSSLDPLGRLLSLEYDLLGRVVRYEFPDPDGAGPDTSPIYTYAYDEVGNEISMTDALGNVTEYAYDDLYRLAEVTQPDPDGTGPDANPVTRYTYDAAHQLVMATDALGRVRKYVYDDLGRIVTESEPDPDGTGPDNSPERTYVYDLMNNELSMTDALGNITQYEYDNLYRLTRIIQADPDGGGPQGNPTHSFAYDVASQLTSSTDPLGRVASYVYDDLGRVIRQTYPDPDGAGPLAAPEMEYTYDLMHNELSMTDAVGNLTQYEYDNLYRLVSVIEADPDGAGPLSNPVTQFTYDIASQMLTVSDPLSRTTSYEYDDLGRVIKATQPDPDGAGPLAAPEMSYVYDSMNNQLSMTDPLGHVTQYEYDNLYRVVRQIDEDLDGTGPLDNPVTVFTYDLVNNMLTLTDPTGNRTDYEYDNLDRIKTETIELGTGNLKSRRFEYDLEDNLTRSTDRNDRVIEYDLDNIYRLVEERWLDASGTVVNTIQSEFDEASQMLRAEDLTVGSRYDYAYDDLSRVTQTTVTNSGPAVVFAYAYDAQSRRTGQTAMVDGAADYQNVYSYDGLNRLSRLDQVGQTGGNVVADKRVEFEYNADDQLTLVSRFNDVAGANLGLQTSYGYDGIGRLVDMVHSNSTSTIVDYGWSFDVASRITQFLNSVDGTSDFDYDNGDQLTSATHVVQSNESYEYDENGNRTNTGYATGFYNRLSSDGTYDYEYDAEGNRTKRTSIVTGAVTEYGWDHRNRLVKVTDRSSENGPVTQTVDHRYDVFNRWISKSVDSDGDGPLGAETTRYEYDGNQIVLEFDGAGSVTHRYLWGPLVDQILAEEQVGDDVYWAAADHQGTIRDLVDSSGNVANHLVYDSFGVVASETNAAVDHLFGFTGRAFDESTGLQNNLNRWYDAMVGRWVSEDPIGFVAGDPNLYRYVENSSPNFIDPAGFDVYGGVQNTAAFTKGFAQGMGVGVGNWAQDSVGMVQGAADYYNYIRMGAFAGGVRLVESGWTFAGGSAFSLDEQALAKARQIGANSGAVKGTDTALQLIQGMDARELAGLAGSIADALGDAAQGWFEKYNKLLEKGCYEQAGRMLGEFVGEILPDVVITQGSGSTGKLGSEGLKDAIIKTLKDERKHLDIDKMLSKGVKGKFRSIDEFAAGRNFPTEIIKEKAWDVYRRARDSSGIIIGFGDDVVKHGTKDGIDVLAFSEKALGLSDDEWWHINKAWLDGAIDAGIPVKLVSRGDEVAIELRAALRRGQDRGLTREIRYLMSKGHPYTLTE